jgi:hypothetical protein
MCKFISTRRIFYSCSITKLNRLKRLLKTSFITVCLKRVFHAYSSRGPRVFHAYSSRGPRVFHAYSSRGPRVVQVLTTRNKREKESLGYTYFVLICLQSFVLCIEPRTFDDSFVAVHNRDRDCERP